MIYCHAILCVLTTVRTVHAPQLGKSALFAQPLVDERPMLDTAEIEIRSLFTSQLLNSLLQFRLHLLLTDETPLLEATQ